MPPPVPKKGPSEYIPSATYPDPFVNMVPGYVPMHRDGCCGPFVQCCPPPPPPPPGPEPEPPMPCPPKIYRNPPDVEIIAGDHITVEKDESEPICKFTVGAVQFPVEIDPESSDILYGDGIPGNPLGIYDFTGATPGSDGKPGTVPAPSSDEAGFFLRGDGSWAPQEQADWDEADPESASFIRNRPELAEVAISGDYNDLVNRVPVYDGTVTGTVPVAADSGSFLRGDGRWVAMRACSVEEMDNWIDEVEGEV